MLYKNHVEIIIHKYYTTFFIYKKSRERAFFLFPFASYGDAAT